MKIHHLKPPPGAHRSRLRRGRGSSARKGNKAGRGTKGVHSRGSGKLPVGYEGGQIPLQRRLPKQPGFTNRNRVEYATVNVRRLEEAFAEGDEVTPDTLRARRLIRSGSSPVKILGEGELSKGLQVTAHAFSRSAREKIEAGGGRATVLEDRRAS